LAENVRELCVVTWPGWEQDDRETRSLIESAGVDVEFRPKVGPRTPDDVATMMERASAAIVSTDPFDRSVFLRAPRLRVIARTGVGIDSIDVDAATRAGVVVTRTSGAHEETVAEHTVALLLAVVRRVLENDASVRRGEWDRAGTLTPWSLQHQCVGIVGLGRIGSAVAQRLLGFGCDVIACDPYVGASDSIELVELDELFRRADVVSLHVPLTPETQTLVSARRIGSMRRGAILVNMSRGELVDEAALVEALVSERLRGAALDVFEQEPPARAQLLQLPNVVLSPHIAGFTQESIRALTAQAVRSVVNVLAGRATPGVVNPEALAHPRHAGDGSAAPQSAQPRGEDAGRAEPAPPA
jgi:D-3-phosphoglycerate dehydrogenase